MGSPLEDYPESPRSVKYISVAGVNSYVCGKSVLKHDSRVAGLWRCRSVAAKKGNVFFCERRRLPCVQRVFVSVFQRRKLRRELLLVNKPQKAVAVNSIHATPSRLERYAHVAGRPFGGHQKSPGKSLGV